MPVARDKNSRSSERETVIEGGIGSEDESEQRNNLLAEENEGANDEEYSAEGLERSSIDDSVYDAKSAQESLENSDDYQTRGVDEEEGMDVSRRRPGRLRSVGMVIMLSEHKPVLPQMKKMERQVLANKISPVSV